MTPLEFIASLDGESKAAALTIHSLMTPRWIEITDDPATLPEVYTVVLMRKTNGREWFGLRTVNKVWVESTNAHWNTLGQNFEISGSPRPNSPTHWRPIG